MHSAIPAVVLAGGKSSRMNCDKTFLRLGSKTMIEEILLRLQKRFSKLMIIANDVVKYMKLGIRVESDILPCKGPLGGIYTALVHSDTLYNFIFACDAPFLGLKLIDYMVDRARGVDIIVPRWRGKFEPLHAIYSKKCMEPIKKQFERGDLKITDFFHKVKTAIIEQEEIEKLHIDPEPFLNINTKEEYNAVLSKVDIS